MPFSFLNDQCETYAFHKKLLSEGNNFQIDEKNFSQWQLNAY